MVGFTAAPLLPAAPPPVSGILVADPFLDRKIPGDGVAVTPESANDAIIPRATVVPEVTPPPPLLIPAADLEVRRAIPVPEPGPLAAPAPGQPTYDDAARFIAGMKFRQGSGYAPFEGSTSLARHQVACRDLAANWESLRLSKMRDWSKREILPQTGNPSTLFYMFGGPDFIHPATLFPDTQEYILAGLEPLGSVPDFYQMTEGGLEAYLVRLRNTLQNISLRNFFETKQMREDFGPNGLDGVFPVLLYFTVLAGNEVLDARFVSLAKDGSLVSATSRNAMGIMIQFRRLVAVSPRTPRSQVLYYFKTDISNSGISGNPRFLQFLGQRNGGGSYLKAASYLMHGGGFSTIRDFLLQRSSFILQDESGIPFRHINQRPWQIQLYGNYVGPMDIFLEHAQPDLRQAYARGNAKALPFGTGYRRTDDESIQILAIRR